MVDEQNFSKYEKARILGARALQISMDAPILAKLKDKDIQDLNYDSLKIAEHELDSGVLPISINRPMPGRREKDIEKIKIKDAAPTEKDIEKEKEEMKNISTEGEIMELANPSDETESS